jgi:hypothetical protein
LSEQVPMLWPEAMLQRPVQQSPFWEHASPAWPHHDEGWHVPPAQRCEQHSAPLWHALPSVEHAAVSAAHLPPLQLWLQHCALAVHG